jgi:hypothetical protein
VEAFEGVKNHFKKSRKKTFFGKRGNEIFWLLKIDKVFGAKAIPIFLFRRRKKKDFLFVSLLF